MVQAATTQYKSQAAEDSSHADVPPVVAPPSADQVSPLKAKSAELILFTTQLSVMLDSGVVLSDAIEAIAEQTKQGNFRIIITDIADRICSGDNFSDSLSRFPKVFDTMYISMIKASEASGEMPQMLEVLSGYLAADAETRKQVKGAMIYPFIMMAMAVAATGSLMFFVLPKFTKIYESRGAALPKLTQALVNFSAILGDINAMAAILTTLIFIGTVFYFWKLTTSGRKTLDWIKIHTPVIGTMTGV